MPAPAGLVKENYSICIFVWDFGLYWKHAIYKQCGNYSPYTKDFRICSKCLLFVWCLTVPVWCLTAPVWCLAAPARSLAAALWSLAAAATFLAAALWFVKVQALYACKKINAKCTRKN